MIVIILVLAAFLILLYVYHFIRWKKRKNDSINTVEKFRRNYADKKTGNYVTNSHALDYIEKEKYISSVKDMAEKDAP